MGHSFSFSGEWCDDRTMASMTEKEMDQSLAEMQDLLGSELVSLCYDEKALQLRFETTDRYWWLSFSLKPGFPYFFCVSSRVHLVRSLKKPLTIFLRTHFVGKTLKNVSRIKESGRVVELKFSEEEFIKVSLFPGGQNIELFAGGKTLYSYKPKEQKPHEGDFQKHQESRENSFFFDHWQKLKKGVPGKPSKKEDDSQRLKDIKKKENGLRKMKEKLSSIEDSQWLHLGNWLKTEQTLDGVPHEWKELVEEDLSLSWNIENSFKQHKKKLAKAEGTKERVSELEKEIEKLKSGKVEKVKKTQESLMVRSEAKGRTFNLGEFKIYVGKSAKDNLSLLRRAKPWFLWLHIRDYPGAYGIIERQKKEGDLPLDVLQKAAHFVVKQSVGDKAEGKFQVIIAECRYVKPIKGAKSGQVTYSHEKVISTKV